MSGDSPATAVRLVPDFPGRGRALVASRSIRPGEVVLSDSPILLYPSLPSNSTSTFSPSSYCTRCFRTLNPASASAPPCCPSCSTDALFCSDRCRALALASSHTPWVCHSLARLRSLPLPPPSDHEDDFLTLAHFLVAAYNLASTSPLDFHRLLSLHGDASAVPDGLAQSLHSLLFSLSPPPTPFGFSPQLTAALLAKDKLNAFGLMEEKQQPSSHGCRAYGIYPSVSFFNHDCLPNACRFDYVDKDSGDRNTDIIIRAIHEISEGREVCISYFPVNLGYKERQRRLLEDYGFQCQCDRCMVEKNWKDDDGGGVEGDGDNGEGMEDMEDEGENGEEEVSMEEEGEDDYGDFPHAYFFVKFMCSKENCGGTLAPLPPSPQGQVSDVYECNYCGCLRKEGESDGGSDDKENGVMSDK